jgi:hypothetical protein
MNGAVSPEATAQAAASARQAPTAKISVAEEDSEPASHETKNYLQSTTAVLQMA